MWIKGTYAQLDPLSETIKNTLIQYYNSDMDSYSPIQKITREDIWILKIPDGCYHGLTENDWINLEIVEKIPEDFGYKL